MTDVSSVPARTPSPLSRPKAAFNGHTGLPPSIKINGQSSNHADTQGYLAPPEADGLVYNEEDVIGQDPSWEPEVYGMGKSSVYCT
jgi:hypothetical protein